jgi:hypothetical protein
LIEKQTNEIEIGKEISKSEEDLSSSLSNKYLENG